MSSRNRARAGARQGRDTRAGASPARTLYGLVFYFVYGRGGHPAPGPDIAYSLLNVAHAGKIDQLWQSYAFLLKIEQAIFCQPLYQLEQPGGVCIAIVGFENWSQVCQRDALVGG
jgi:hypothetical protein